MLKQLRSNRTQAVLLGILLLIFLVPVVSFGPADWVITVLRGLSTGSVIFLAAAGLSLIFGLMDVLNLAHGTLFMIGAYVGWTVYARPDTAIDVGTPVLLVIAAFLLRPVWDAAAARIRLPGRGLQALGWLAVAAGAVALLASVRAYPINSWDVNLYNESPPAYAAMMDQGQLQMPVQRALEPGAFVAILAGLLAGSALCAFGFAAVARARAANPLPPRVTSRAFVLPAALALIAIALGLAGPALKAGMFAMPTTPRFFVAVALAVAVGAGLGGLMEATVIRPLYSRPIYQLMLTLGLGVIGREIVIAVWGRVGFTMAKPALFDGSGPGCPARSIGDWLQYNCGTIVLFDTRVRVYNEIFLIVVGVVVLVLVWLVIQRSRLGMVIRAGVQDRVMVEALGINVRRVFTLVFAVGVGLATLGGVLNAPSVGVSELMGESLLLLALIALAIGGLTSFPGAAAGSVLVGLLQQFMIKFGQIGIQLPFFAEPFKPTPPLVPASSVLLMIIVLLLLPQGLFGRKES